MAILPRGSTFNQFLEVASAARAERSGRAGIITPEPGSYTFDLRPTIANGGDTYGFKGLPAYGCIIEANGPPGSVIFNFLGDPGPGHELIRFQATEQATYPYCGFWGNGWEILGPTRIDWTRQALADVPIGCDGIGLGNRGMLGTADGGWRISQIAGGAIAIRKDHELIGAGIVSGRWGIHHTHGYDGGQSRSGGDQRVKGLNCDGMGEAVVFAEHDNSVGGVTYEDLNAANCPVFFLKGDNPNFDVNGNRLPPTKTDIGAGCILERVHMENLGQLMRGDSTGKTTCDGLKIKSVFANQSLGERAGGSARVPIASRRGFVDKVAVRGWQVNDPQVLVGSGNVGYFTGCALWDTNLGDMTPAIDWLARTDLGRNGASRALVTHDANANERYHGSYRGMPVRGVFVAQGTKKGQVIYDSNGTRLGIALLDAPVQNWPTKATVPVLWDGPSELV